MVANTKNVPSTAPLSASSALTRQMRSVLLAGSVTLFTLLLVMAYLMPLGYAGAVSLRGNFTDADAPLYPAKPAVFTYEGNDYDIYKVPVDGTVRDLAIIKKGREKSTFVDPANPTQPIEWEGRWRTLERVWQVSPQWSNYSEAWRITNFARLFGNTFLIAGIGTIGTLLSSIVVAYGFSRFRIPGKNILFIILVGTIILPPQVTLVPTYTLFNNIGWTGTWLPLLVPHFFANAYNVFLLRQFFMGIPREMDEAAMIDGASPFRTLVSVIVPQAVPAIIAVSLFHFFWAWNDFFGPLIYLVGQESLWPISVGMTYFRGLFNTQPNLIQATAIMALALPVVIFFLAQRVFMQGVVVTGVEK
ncbi:MAG: carbohydrate ABC transporter permease [Roseiflexaceae bacterium]